jgi:mRNA-degrading endonuclease RelE of RelBE toxin-antitoxin system
MRVVVEITGDAREQLNRLPTRIAARMTKLIARLEAWPAVSGAKPLRGDLVGHYRLRTGDYRLQYRVVRVKAETAGDEDVALITVERVGHRDGFYEG